MEIYTYKEMYLNEEHHWWFAGTRNILFSIMDKFVRKDKNIKILDIGCGTGIVMKKLESYGEAFGIDISDEAILFCAKRGIKNIFKADAAKLPFENNNFDLITSFDVLEHIDKPVIALKEIYRVLNINGIAIISVPAYKFLWSSHDEALHHVTRFTISELKELILLNNFEILKISYFDFFLFPIIALVRIIKNISQKIMNKNIKQTDLKNTSGLFNKILISILNLEAKILKKINFPYGVSILAIIKKKD